MHKTYTHRPAQADVKIPDLSRALVEALNHAFPERCPRPTDTEREIWMYAGRRDLVRYLKKQLEVLEHVTTHDRLPI